jgi:hypothetical protein
MRKMFKDLKVGDKIYVDKFAEFVRAVVVKDGFMCIQAHYNLEDELKPWQGWKYCIPMNHMKANKVKVKNRIWIHITKRGYRKYMNEFIEQQIRR